MMSIKMVDFCVFFYFFLNFNKKKEGCNSRRKSNLEKPSSFFEIFFEKSPIVGIQPTC